MLGRSHCVSGVAAFLAADTALQARHLLTLTPSQVALGAAVCAGAAVLPDIDHHDSSVARTFGPLTRALAWLVGHASGGHRNGTHSALGVAVFTGLALLATRYRHTIPGAIGLAVLLALVFAAALRALRVGGWLDDLLPAGVAAYLVYSGADLGVVPLAVGVGVAAHIAGDMLTHEGCPLAWPASQKMLGVDLVRTGHAGERYIIVPLLLLAIAALVTRRFDLLSHLGLPTPGLFASP